MKHLMLWLCLYASCALAQPGPGPSAAEARSQCERTKSQFQAVRSFPRTEPAKTQRETAFQALAQVHAEARKVRARDATELLDSPGGNTLFVKVHPLRELAVVGECGGGWLLTSLLVRSDGHTYFETGYIRADKLLAVSPSCTDVTRLIQQDPYQRSPKAPADADPLYVIGSAVMVREGPDAEAPVLQKLGYGVAVRAASRDCGDWILVDSPLGGSGFVHKDSLGATLYDEATLRARQAQAPTVAEQSLWALARAHFFPSEGNRKEAVALHMKARETLSPREQGRCESFVGSCDVLLKDSLYTQKRLDADPRVGQVPVGPWWVLATATSAAQVAVFRGASVHTSGECNCGGCETCQTTLNLSFELLGRREPIRYLAAARRPPASWFRALSTEGCAKAEQTARKSPKWEVPLYGGDAKRPATAGAGKCIPGDDGSVWWQQAWHHPELSDMESDEVLRTYRIQEGRVVQVGKLSHAHGNAQGAMAWTASPVVAWRDFDGDGKPDELTPCPFGGYCTQAKGFTR